MKKTTLDNEAEYEEIITFLIKKKKNDVTKKMQQLY